MTLAHQRGPRPFFLVFILPALAGQFIKGWKKLAYRASDSLPAYKPYKVDGVHRNCRVRSIMQIRPGCIPDGSACMHSPYLVHAGL